jgi:hypothetical protein
MERSTTSSSSSSSSSSHAHGFCCHYLFYFLKINVLRRYTLILERDFPL